MRCADSALRRRLSSRRSSGWSPSAGHFCLRRSRLRPTFTPGARLSEVRGELWQDLSHGRTQAIVDEIKHIDEQLVTLWDEHRAERARIRFGERDEIVRRARQEERLERAA